MDQWAQDLPLSRTTDMIEAAGLKAQFHFKPYELVWSLSQINFPAVFPDRPLSADISLNRWTCAKSIGWPSPPCTAWHLLADMTELAQSYLTALHPPSPTHGCPVGLGALFEDTKEKMKLFPSSASLPRRLGDIFTPARMPLHTFRDAFGELNAAANHRAQWCPATLLLLLLHAYWHFPWAASQFSTQLFFSLLLLPPLCFRHT